jgi:hypothetical protein
MPHALRVALLVCLCLPAPASALTFAFSGTVETVTDGSNFLDASVAPGTAVTGTYEVTPTSADGSSPFGVGLAQLSFQVGNYLFDTSQGSHTIALIDDRDTGIPGITVDLWQSLAIVATDLSPATNFSGDFGGYAAQIEFYDSESAVFDGSESEPFVPGDYPAAPWDQARLTLNSVNGSSNLDGRVQVQVDITSWGLQPVPEPRSSVLLALGLASFAHQRRRARGR